MIATDCPENAVFDHMQAAFSQELGVLVAETRYYDFSGTDRDGNIWKAEALSCDWSFGALAYLTTDVRSLESRQPSPVRGSSINAAVFAVVPGKFDLPWHTVTNLPNGSQRDTFDADADDFGWTIQKREKFIEIAFHASHGDMEQLYRKFLIALSILCGKSINPAINVLVENGQRITRLRSQHRPLWSAELAPPLPMEMPDAPEAHRFIRRFITHGQSSMNTPQDHTELVYNLWHRTLRAGKNDIENSALVLTVAIEALAGDAFLSPLDEDEAFIHELAEARKLIEVAAFPQRAQARIFASLDGASTPNPRSALYRLTEQGFIGKDLVRAWIRLRNSSAHGDKFGESSEEIQSSLNLYFKCLTLLYRLIFTLIGYRGIFVDRATAGWPKAQFGALG